MRKPGPTRRQRLFLNSLSLVALLTVLLARPVVGGAAVAPSITPVPAREEPLHVVRHHGEQFLIYTNWIEPGVWTQFHSHRQDLLAVIAGHSVAASQTPGNDPREQAAPAGTVLFFPYADATEPFVHRVGARGDTPFINVGLEFLDPPEPACAEAPGGWREARAERLKSNRRGQAYRLEMPPGSAVPLPGEGRGLLLVPLTEGGLQVDDGQWAVTAGDFRFYERKRPALLHNPGRAPAILIVFLAC